MKKLLNTDRLYYHLGWTLLGLLLLLLVLEGWRYGIKPSETDTEQLIERSLDNAVNHFTAQQQELLTNSEDLAATLRPALIQNQSNRYLQNVLTQFPQFWSASLFRQNFPIVWNGFALKTQTNRQAKTSEPSLELKKFNNVVYWECHVPITVQDSSGTVSYDLFTSYRIEQENPLSIGDDSEFSIFNSSSFTSSYPLNFNVFNTPATLGVEASQLSDLQGDSVGVVYATADKFQQTQNEWQQNTRFWRSVFALLCFIVLTILLFFATDNLRTWKALALHLLLIGSGWAIFTFTDMPSYWVLTLSQEGGNEWVATVKNLSTICTNALFALLAAVAIARKLVFYRRKFSADWFLSSISLSGIYGLINAFGIITFFHLMYDSAIASGVPLLDLRIFPVAGTIVLYLAIGVATLAAGIFLVAINRMLFRITKEHFKLSASVFIAAFAISLLVAQLFLPQQFIFNWFFYSSIVAFAIVLSIAAGYSLNMPWITVMSPLRGVVMGSCFIAIIGTPVIYQAAIHNTDDELWETALSYAREDDPFAAELTRDLLNSLEQNFRDISQKDLQTNRSTLQSRFTGTIQSFLSAELNSYSFDLQLINTSGELIADYSTDLNSPDWLNIYNIATLQVVTEMEQITKSTIQPIVQQPQLINQQSYRTFYRGWIPVFGVSEDQPIAWILCSIYQERPEFNKPIRAVMASLTYDDWNTAYLMQKFQDGKLINSAQKGFAGYFPKYRSLSQQRLKALQADSLIYLTESSSNFSYRTLLWSKSPTRTIKISTSLPGYRLVLFSFFRLSFTLLLIGGLGLLLLQVITWGKVKFFGQNQRFQDRILDSFLLATLIFLAFLIATSHYAIKQQNRDIVRQELVDKLERLSNTIEESSAVRNNRDLNASFSLDSLTTPLDVDASFYAGRTVTETTTPQIYQQHLLPAVLPYDIFQQLFNERQQDAQTTVTLADQTLLIGYRSILNDQNQPVATIAIPTFLESPKYDQQLLETTSYLILGYLLVFGLFMMGATIISKQLTRPLVYIQRGLNKISSGNLDTTIPVKSDDEIGNLAKAYNNMVSRLKKLQQELAEAEREAAWKEMAQQVAHEIKNPLTPMKLNVQHLERQLKDEEQDPEKLKKRVQKITNNLIEQIQSLNNIASDFSKFSQPLDEEFTNVNLTSIISSVSELYKHDDDIAIHFEQNSTINVQGIGDELKRVVINLVKNAYEAMPNGEGKIVLRLYKQQQDVFIEVEDNGQGIPEENRPNIFVPNFSTKSSGTGLGLAICKKIVEAHNGSISFASVEGKGTTFVIKLPQN